MYMYMYAILALKAWGRSYQLHHRLKGIGHKENTLRHNVMTLFSKLACCSWT